MQAGPATDHYEAGGSLYRIPLFVVSRPRQSLPRSDSGMLQGFLLPRGSRYRILLLLHPRLGPTGAALRERSPALPSDRLFEERDRDRSEQLACGQNLILSAWSRGQDLARQDIAEA